MIRADGVIKTELKPLLTRSEQVCLGFSTAAYQASGIIPGSATANGIRLSVGGAGGNGTILGISRSRRPGFPQGRASACLSNGRDTEIELQLISMQVAVS